MAEWDAPLICLGSGFNVDMNLNSKRTRVARRMYYDGKSQANGGAYFSLNGGKPSTYDLYGNPWPEDMIDRTTTPADMLKTYFEHFQNAHSTTKDKGYYASITGNHDHLRFNMGDRNSPEQLKVMMAWIMTMPLPILYYGDEIGMRSLVNLPNVEGANHNGKERSGARTPMQWDDSENAGFSTCTPDNIYLPVCPEWTPATSYDAYLEWKADGCKKPTSKGMITVESQDADPESLLNWTRCLIALRKEAKPFWASSDFTPVFDESHPYPMVYTRSDGEQTYLIALNPTGAKQSVTLPGLSGKKASLKPVLSSGKASCNLSAKGARLVMGPTSVFICPLPE